MVVFNRNFDPDAASGTGVGERVGRGTKSLVLLGHTKKELDPTSTPLHRSARGKEKDGNRRRRGRFSNGGRKNELCGEWVVVQDFILGRPIAVGKKREKEKEGGGGVAYWWGGEDHRGDLEWMAWILRETPIMKHTQIEVLTVGGEDFVCLVA